MYHAYIVSRNSVGKRAQSFIHVNFILGVHFWPSHQVRLFLLAKPIKS